MNPNARKPDESFASYKIRRLTQNKMLTAMQRGRVIWNSLRQGTYRKAEHGPIGG